MEEAPESFLTPLTMRGHGAQTAIYEPGRGLSPDIKSAGALSVDFSLQSCEK